VLAHWIELGTRTLHGVARPQESQKKVEPALVKNRKGHRLKRMAALGENRLEFTNTTQKEEQAILTIRYENFSEWRIPYSTDLLSDEK